MNPKLVAAVVMAAKDAFKTMVFMDLQEGAAYQSNGKRPPTNCTGLIGLSGKLTGAVAVHFPESFAIKVVSSMLGESIKELSQDVRDGIGEITNLVAGGIKTILSRDGLDFDISVPTVFSGENMTSQMMLQSPSVIVPFSCSGESFCVELGVKNI